MAALHGTTSWALVIASFCLTYYMGIRYYHLQHRITTPMGLRYYHLQAYTLLSPWALGISTFRLTYYYPLMLQTLPPSAMQPILTDVSRNILYWRGQVFLQLWDSVFVFRVSQDRFDLWLSLIV